MSVVDALFSPSKKAIREGLDAARLQIADELAPQSKALSGQVEDAQGRYAATRMRHGVKNGLNNVAYKVTGSPAAMARKIRGESALAKAEAHHRYEFDTLHEQDQRLGGVADAKLEQTHAQLRQQHKYTDLKHRAKLVAGAGLAAVIADSASKRNQSIQIQPGY